MKDRNVSKLYRLFSLILMLFAIGICFSFCNIGKKADAFKQVGYFKSNSSPYTRIFSIYSKTTNVDSMVTYAQKKPFTMGGHTEVLFFNDLEKTPDVTFLGWNYDEKLNENLLLKYVIKDDGAQTVTTYK